MCNIDSNKQQLFPYGSRRRSGVKSPRVPVREPQPINKHDCRLQVSGQCYVTVTLVTFDKQSNGRRIEVESYSCNRRISTSVVRFYRSVVLYNLRRDLGSVYN